MKNKLIPIAIIGAVLASIAYFFAGNSGEMYGAGGYIYDPQAQRQFLAELGPKRFLRDFNPAIYGDSTEEAFLYRAVQKCKPNHLPMDQGECPSCVSFGFGCAVDILLAQQVVLGQSDHFQPCVEESIYGGARCEAAGTSNSGGGGGANCSLAAKYLKNWGVLYRQSYPDIGLDVSAYSIQRCVDWGRYGQGGRNQQLKQFIIDLCRKHPVKQVAAIQTAKDAAAAIRAGYPVVFGSSLLPSNQRNGQGFSSLHWGGGHCQAMIGYRNKDGIEGILVQNSWNKFNSGGKYPEDQPDGSYWVTMRDAQALIGGEAYALSDLQGFPMKDIGKLNREGW